MDAGPSTFYWLKEKGNSRRSAFTENTFKTVINNLTGLHKCRQRKGNRGNVKLNVGYVIVSGNVAEIYEASKQVKEAGADMIRFKCDIANIHDLVQTDLLDSVFSQIERAKNEFHNPPAFSVHSIHSRQEIEIDFLDRRPKDCSLVSTKTISSHISFRTIEDVLTKIKYLKLL